MPAFRVGIGVNHSRVDETGGVFGTNSVYDDPFAGMGVRLAIAAEWSPRLAFELGWSRFGTNDALLAEPPPVPPAQPDPAQPACPTFDPSIGCGRLIPVEQGGSALWVAYTPTWVTEYVDFYGKIGAVYVDVEPASFFFDADWELMLGVGARYRFNERFAMQLDVEPVGSSGEQIGLSVVVGI